jgi:hypothetical protein
MISKKLEMIRNTHVIQRKVISRISNSAYPLMPVGTRHNPTVSANAPRLVPVVMDLAFTGKWARPLAASGRASRAIGERYALEWGTGEIPPMETPLPVGDVTFRRHSGGHSPTPNLPIFPNFARHYIHVRQDRVESAIHDR